MASFTDPKTISSTVGISIDPANCVLWLDASDISTFYQLSANNGLGYDPTQPVTSDGEPVGAWLDKSGYNHNFGVITTVNRPIYSLSSVYFDPTVTNKWLECIDENIYSYRNNAVDPLSGLTIFIVSELASTAGSTSRVLFTQLSTTNVAIAYNSTSITSPIVVQSGSSLATWCKYTAARASNSLNPDYLTTINPFIPTTTTVYAYNNLLQLMVGGSPTNAAAPSFSNDHTTIKRIRIGADLNNFTAPTLPFFGRIREIIVYNIPLTFQQQKFVEAYLGEKWRAPYISYPDSSGGYNTSSVWFNNVVPTLSSATVLANGYVIDVTTSGVYPKFQNRRFTNWGWADPGISKGGTFIINGNVNILTERVWQDVTWGDIQRTAANGYSVSWESLSPVIGIPSGSTLNLSADSIQCLSFTVPALTASGTVKLDVPYLYGHSTSPVLRATNNANITINNALLAVNNRWHSTTVTSPGVVVSVNSGSTCTFNNCDLRENLTLLAPEATFDLRVNKCTHVYNNHGTTIFNNCLIGSYGYRQSSTTNAYVTNTTEAIGSGVYLNSSGGVSYGYFNNCTLECANVNTPADKIAVYLNGLGTRSYFNNCTIKGSNFDTSQTSKDYSNAGLIVATGALAEIVNSTVTGGAGNGTYTSGTLRYDNIGSYPAGIRMSGATSILTLSSCSVYGSPTKKAQGIHGTAGILNTFNCKFFAGPDSNAINGQVTTGNISGPIIEDYYTGYRAIALPKYFINPVPKNSYIKYATDGTGLGFNAFTYQYTIDSLSAFSMPDVSAVRLGTPYAGGLLVGTAVIPPAEAVSYGTLVDNTTGSAILTLDLLNTFFQTPLSSLAAPALSGTIGYRIANTLTSNESIGHLIASFTTN